MTGKRAPKIPANKYRKIKKAIQLFKRFRGNEPEFIDQYDVEKVDVAMLIGQCDGVMYTTVRDGKKESYIHEFTGKSKPMLAASWNGEQIVFIGGNYSFTEEGIKDNG